MWKWLLFACLLLPLSAWASPRPTDVPEPPVTYAPTPAPGEQMQSQSGTHPAGNTSRFQLCGDLVPSGIEYSGEGFETLLSVRITPVGEVRDTSVFHSSGNLDFDTAAIACSTRQRLGPILQNGKPADIDWIVRVDWRRHWPFLISAALPNSKPHECGMEWYPRAAYGTFIQGDTKLAYSVTEDGSVKNATVENSSGDPDLDSAAVNCVSTWRYYPATENGTPIEFEFKTVIYWRRHF